MLEDIAIVTGGQLISEGLGIKFESVTLAMLGRAKRARIEKENTTIIDGAGKIKAASRPAARRFVRRSRKRPRITTTTKRSCKNGSRGCHVAPGPGRTREASASYPRLAEAEIAGKFVAASKIYAGNSAALRAMNIIYETTKERGTTILIPTSMVDSMNPASALVLAGQSAQSPSIPVRRSNGGAGEADQVR